MAKTPKFERKWAKTSATNQKSMAKDTAAFKATKLDAPQKQKDAARVIEKKADKDFSRNKKAREFVEKKYAQDDRKREKGGFYK